MDAGIAVAVRDVDVAVWGEGGVGAAMERLAAHVLGRLAGDAQLQEDLAVLDPAFAHERTAVVGQVDRVVGSHVDAVRPRILPLAPRSDKVAGAIEHHHRVVAAVEDIDVVVVVDADCADLLERPAVRQLRPVLDDAVAVLAGADDDGHCSVSRWI